MCAVCGDLGIHLFYSNSCACLLLPTVQKHHRAGPSAVLPEVAAAVPLSSSDEESEEEEEEGEEEGSESGEEEVTSTPGRSEGRWLSWLRSCRVIWC